MQMNSVPQHLLSEDRQEYERILDEALRSAPHRPELAAVGQRLNPEQLRTMALNATALITAAATAEYQHYVKVREELRHPAPTTPPVREEAGSAEPGSSAMGLAATVGEVTETAGAGAIAVVAVLAPVLAGTAAAIFLLVGYILKMLDPEPAFAKTLLTTGWVFGAVTAVAILVAAVGLLLTALRNGSSSLQAGARGELDEQVARAREAWRDALLARGILPFLREALADPGAAAMGRTSPTPISRMPQLGYNRPGFSSPDGGPAAGPRPSYSSPDFSSPDFGGPEHQPE
ncbi:hypothetical protein OG266_22465 [Streptomyces sp. NBC_00554]|uniref:hypothetical protein n=1 Tax=unclassified Streptomyces TaxID=2593676 RepID=UPI0022508CD0|nr:MULTISPECIES: hypothetical protein [unclassified Streptomyces]MCX4973082.1 hypothetical protein [Streptomyces sp. NBC_00620]WUC51015.1 hypothetical protein OG266_22465 [Streptomyces sp. NBC_00554]